MSDLTRDYIRRFVNKRGTTVAGLERMAGCGRTSINGVMIGKNNMGRDLFERIDAIVGFPAECHEEMEQIERANSHRRCAVRSNCNNHINEPFPWPLTVARLKADPPIYSRAW